MDDGETATMSSESSAYFSSDRRPSVPIRLRTKTKTPMSASSVSLPSIADGLKASHSSSGFIVPEVTVSPSRRPLASASPGLRARTSSSLGSRGDFNDMALKAGANSSSSSFTLDRDELATRTLEWAKEQLKEIELVGGTLFLPICAQQCSDDPARPSMSHPLMHNKQTEFIERASKSMEEVRFHPKERTLIDLPKLADYLEKSPGVFSYIRFAEDVRSLRRLCVCGRRALASLLQLVC